MQQQRWSNLRLYIHTKHTLYEEFFLYSDTSANEDNSFRNHIR